MSLVGVLRAVLSFVFMWSAGMALFGAFVLFRGKDPGEKQLGIAALVVAVLCVLTTWVLNA